jgi:hypothetical protein
VLCVLPLLCRRAGRARGFDAFFEQQRRGCTQMLRVRMGGGWRALLLGGLMYCLS